MNETTEKAVSCLAITEKRAHRPGGCVGIFFQLFDWNKRFATKKIFSRKLLPAARGKASKKFGGDEKMPKSKLHLIADENSGGFPNVKKHRKHSVDIEQKHEMRTPSLVARLMGLESVPAANRDKPRKALTSGDDVDRRDEKLANGQDRCNGEDVILEKGSTKMEPRPQKIQRTGQFESRAVTRFGNEALQIKSVLSRARKHHHHHHHHNQRLTPLKSPRISSVRNASKTSRLIGAATKILEPGLQATNRSKCSLAYSGSFNYSTKNEDFPGQTGFTSPDASKHSSYCADNTNLCKSLMGHASCKKCGSLLDVLESRPNVEQQQFIYPSDAANMVDPSYQEMETVEPRPPMSSVNQGEDVRFPRSWDPPISFNVQEAGTQHGSESRAEKISLSLGQAQRLLTSQQGTQKDEQTSVAFRHQFQIQNKFSIDGNRVPQRAKLNKIQSKTISSASNGISGPKDFISFNRNLGGCTRLRVSSNVENSTLDLERKSFNQQNNSLSQLTTPVRKRRTSSVSEQTETKGSGYSIISKERDIKRNAVAKKVHNAHVKERTCVRTRLANQESAHRANDDKNTDVVSFAFSSPLKQKAGISHEMNEKRNDQSDNIKSPAHQRTLVSNDTNGGTSFQKKLPLTRDVLGAILEKKLRELTSQEDVMATPGTQPKRSTAIILQELISALTAELPILEDGCLYSSDAASQTDDKSKEMSVGFVSHDLHLSPGCVLDASFSNDSGVSSSLDDSLGPRLHYDSLIYPYDELEPTETDLLDSATSWRKGRTYGELVQNIVNRTFRMLHSITHAAPSLSGDKTTYMKETIWKLELLFGNATPQDSHEIDNLLLGPFVHQKVEDLVGAISIDFRTLLGFDQTKESSQLRGFLIDCAIECLDSKYDHNTGFKAWRRLPSHMSTETLLQDVGEGVRRWTQMVGMVPDELIEWEMSHSLGKWTDFDAEAFETGIEIDNDILQILVEEIVAELWKC